MIKKAKSKTAEQVSERERLRLQQESRHGICETVKVLSFSSKLPNREHTVQNTPCGAGLCPCVPRHSFLKTTLKVPLLHSDLSVGQRKESPLKEVGLLPRARMRSKGLSDRVGRGSVACRYVCVQKN